VKLETHVLPLAAAISYALGGACMKLSEGFQRPLATVGLYALFVLGATLQTLALKRADLGVSYVLVLGLEAVVAFGIALYFFDETVAPVRALGVVLILAGTFLLR
jgi:multidrug transporter EmrE-like cation transporter